MWLYGMGRTGWDGMDWTGRDRTHVLVCTVGTELDGTGCDWTGGIVLMYSYVRSGRNWTGPDVTGRGPVLSRPRSVTSRPRPVLSRPRPVLSRPRPVTSRPRPVLSRPRSVLSRPVQSRPDPSSLIQTRSVLSRPCPVTSRPRRDRTERVGMRLDGSGRDRTEWVGTGLDGAEM